MSAKPQLIPLPVSDLPTGRFKPARRHYEGRTVTQRMEQIRTTLATKGPLRSSAIMAELGTTEAQVIYALRTLAARGEITCTTNYQWRRVS